MASNVASSLPVETFQSTPSNYDQFLSLEQGLGNNGIADDAKPSNKTGYYMNKSFTVLEAKKILCEFIGTFLLILGCVGTAIVGSKPSSTLGIHGVAGGAAFTVMIVIFSTGHISGAHVNPAVTLAFASLCRFPWIQVPLYVAAQLLGSICASFVLREMFHVPGIHAGVTVPSGSDLQSFMVEVIISAIMMFVVAAVATDTQAVGHLAAVAVAASIYLNNLLASGISGASMNPVRTLGPALAANEFRGLWLYLLGPVFGTQLGAALYTLIRTT